MKVTKRKDDYINRREHLKNLSDEELYDRFWNLVDEVVDPLLELATENTSVSIERSVLLRMGFSSLEIKPIVEAIGDRDLLKYGAGHIVYLASKLNNISIQEAGKGLADGKYFTSVIESLK